MDSEAGKEGPQPTTQITLRGIVRTIDQITRQGSDTAPAWANYDGELNPVNFSGYTAFNISRLKEIGKTVSPTFPVASIKLFRPTEFGEKRFEYTIVRREGKLKIDKHESLWTELDKQENREIQERMRSKDPKESRQAVGESRDKLYEQLKSRAEEKATGLSFVGESESVFLLELLEKICEQEK
jgi:hypothetical protein